MQFQNPTCGNLAWSETLDEIQRFFAADPKATYSLVVGTDSEQVLGITQFVVAIVVHRHGKGARYFWAREKKPLFATLRDRIWQEVIFSTTVAKSLADEMVAREVESSNVQVHVDIGENGPTRALIREITGYVTGNGFVPHIKPEAYAAAAVADRLV